jgi:hypothetical protein
MRAVTPLICASSYTRILWNRSLRRKNAKTKSLESSVHVLKPEIVPVPGDVMLIAQARVYFYIPAMLHTHEL